MSIIPMTCIERLFLILMKVYYTVVEVEGEKWMSL